MATQHVLQAEIRRYIISNVVNFLQEDNRADTFDAIAGRGMSGLLIASPVALALGKDLVIVRKPTEAKGAGEFSHGMVSPNKIRWIGIDDWVSGGATMSAILATMKDFEYPPPTALLLYANEGAAGEVTLFNLNAGTYVPGRRSYTLSCIKDKTPLWLPPYSATTVNTLLSERK